MAKALVLKTSGRKPLQVRVLHPPLWKNYYQKQLLERLFLAFSTLYI